jgi:Acetyltransferase (GNAT) domain
MSQQSIQILGEKLTIQGKLFRTARLEEEWYKDVSNPADFIKAIQESGCGADVFNFWQRLPDVVPKYNYCMERDPVAVIPITTYANWWDKQIDSKTRNMVRRAEKKGVVVRRCEFDDKFVEGMTSLFNETPVRQGKPFWHYGKDAATIKREFSRFIFREELFGAYLGEELIGFIFIADTGNAATLGQIISKIAHRDKAPTNALVAKAVERCAEKGVPYLSYAKWVDGSLGEFKRNNGFQRFDLPRYFAPLTLKGRLCVSLKLHRGINVLPEPVLRLLKDTRKKVLERQLATTP